MNRIFITGDTHGEMSMRRFATKKWADQKELDKNDYLIIAGDFGLLWKNGIDRTELYWTKWLNEKKFTTLFIDGNHENFERINALPVIEKFGGKVGQVSDSIFHLKRGEIYTINGWKFFCFGGAHSIDKMHRMTGISWWPGENPTYQETNYALDNLYKNNWEVDFILTHTLPRTYLITIGLISQSDHRCTTSEFLSHVLQMTRFKKWFCGHWHEDDDRGKFHILYETIIELPQRTTEEK